MITDLVDFLKLAHPSLATTLEQNQQTATNYATCSVPRLYFFWNALLNSKSNIVWNPPPKRKSKIFWFCEHPTVEWAAPATRTSAAIHLSSPRWKTKPGTQANTLNPHDRESNQGPNGFESQ